MHLAASDQPNFETQIRPIFTASCVACHSADRPQAHLRLDSLDGALRGGNSGAALIPGDSHRSLLYQRISITDAKLRMPPAGAP